MEPFTRISEAGMPGLLEIEPWRGRYPNLTAGFTGRDGGVSPAPFHSLNCGLHVADHDDYVVANRARISDAVGIPLGDWVYGEQVHGRDVAVVTNADKGKGTLTRAEALQAKDAFITNEKEMCLAAMFADCVPLYFYDPDHQAVGLAHAGWKGTVLEIARQTAQAMAERYGSRPERLVAAIGPSIGMCCYEVDDKVMSHVLPLLQKLGVQDESPFLKSAGNGKTMLNLQQINRQIMIKAGILPMHIEITRWCTSCRNDVFFSHRKDNGATGRMIAWIGLRG